MDVTLFLLMGVSDEKCPLCGSGGRESCWLSGDCDDDSRPSVAKFLADEGGSKDADLGLRGDLCLSFIGDSGDFMRSGVML
jgi:hypothetical protein